METRAEKRNRQLEMAKEMGLNLVHPDYKTEWEKQIMFPGKPGVMGILDSEYPKYLKIRECARREVRGMSKGKNNYLGAFLKLNFELAEELVDAKLNLVTTYTSNPGAVRPPAGVLHEGEANEDGNLYVPYFRVFVPYEEYLTLSRIGKLKDTWNRKTLTEGKAFGDVSAYRVKCVKDGYAAKLVESYSLPPSLINRLTQTCRV